MLNILVLVDHARGISGPHRNVVGSLNALSRRSDVHVRLLCGEFDQNEPFASSQTMDIRLGYNPHDTFGIVTNAQRVLNAARGCDVIYVPSGLKSLLYAQLARLGKRLVAGPNVSHLPIRKEDSPGRIELRLLCDSWFEASRSRQDHVIRCTGYKKVGVINHAIDTEKWGPRHRNPAIWDRFGIPAGCLKILYVGRDEPRKGVSQLLDAFQLVLNRTAEKVHLIIVGQMQEPTLKKISATGSTTTLGFVGPDQLPEVYASADICIIPSSWENFAFTVLESLASGVATISSTGGGIPEQILDGESGRLVEISDSQSQYLPEAPELIAAALLELVENPELRAKLGAGGRQRVFDRFSEARLGQDLVNLFREVCVQ